MQPHDPDVDRPDTNVDLLNKNRGVESTDTDVVREREARDAREAGRSTTPVREHDADQERKIEDDRLR